MLNDTEKKAIQSGFNRINNYITDLLETIDSIKQNQEKILALIDLSSRPDYVKDLEKLYAMKKILSNTVSTFNDLSELSDEITQQYKTFLIDNIANINLNTYLVNDVYSCEIFNKLAKFELDNITTYKLAFNDLIIYIMKLPQTLTSHIDHIINLSVSISIYDKIKNINNNIIMIGANGSGKSTLARHLKSFFSKNTVIISAQHILHYKNSGVIYPWNNSYEKYHRWAIRDKLFSQEDYDYRDNLFSEMEYLIEALKSEHNNCMSDYYDKESDKQISKLSNAIKLWDKLIKHRRLKYEVPYLYVTNDNTNNNYEYDDLSDGEKCVFYYIANVLLAPENSYIIIDEPENHLHLNLCTELWNELELIRPDCKYIYLTHDCHLAATRTNTTIIWNKSYIPPDTWDFEILEENEIIPSKLMMEILGSTKTICFCEGTNQSIDYKLYSILFPEYICCPVGGHLDVIAHVKAYNKIPGKINDAIGIIDKDYHLPAQIESWKESSIYTIPVNEVENILVDEHILKKMIEQHYSPANSLVKFQEDFWETLSRKKEEMAINYTRDYYNNTVQENLLKRVSDIDGLIKEISTKFDETIIRKTYEETIEKIDKLIVKRDYKNAIAFVNFKGILTKGLAGTHIVDGYVKRLIDQLKTDDELKQFIITNYFQPLSNLKITK